MHICTKSFPTSNANIANHQYNSKLYFIILSTLHIYVHHSPYFFLIYHKCSTRWSCNLKCLCFCWMPTSYHVNCSKVKGCRTQYCSTQAMQSSKRYLWLTMKSPSSSPTIMLCMIIIAIHALHGKFIPQTCRIL